MSQVGALSSQILKFLLRLMQKKQWCKTLLITLFHSFVIANITDFLQSRRCSFIWVMITAKKFIAPFGEKFVIERTAHKWFENMKAERRSAGKRETQTGDKKQWASVVLECMRKAWGLVDLRLKLNKSMSSASDGKSEDSFRMELMSHTGVHIIKPSNHFCENEMEFLLDQRCTTNSYTVWQL